MSPEPGQLALRLAKLIEGSGPISVAEYMRAANEEYYASGDPFGVEGDFITAPEITQMFGELVGMWLTDIWMRQNRPEICHYVELGPGRGTLAADALRSMAQFDFAPAVHLVETSDALRATQSENVPSATFHDGIASLPTDGPLLIVANEFFDALPVRQLVLTHAGWRERVVVRERGTKFAAMPGSSAMDGAVPEGFRKAPVGSIVETSPDASGLMYELAGRLASQGGVMLVIDYGYVQPGLGSTLQAVKAHAYADPFLDPGTCDLTAHVNFLELGNMARMRELGVVGPTTQGVWLSALGIHQRAALLAEASPESADEINAARDRLVKAEAMGTLFKVLAAHSPDWPVPEGFGTRCLSRASR
ncbi:MAG TPA: SAM-dependent methyltransferase [Sphingorhabdus sp.]|nr:SAM-dependent methyltransferase [Sphingorhabdus sp.]